MQSIEIRPLQYEELEDIWNIDRREVVENVYYLSGGQLMLKPDYFDIQGWPPGDHEKYTPIGQDCFRRGGAFFGAFTSGKIVGAAILESKFIGKEKDQLQIPFLHVSRDFRGQGLGRRLFEIASRTARQRGAKRLYISATPSENTIRFYINMGCILASEIDPHLYALEPEDIHLEFIL